MILADFHVHTKCSPDATGSILDSALAAIKNGVSILCTTDHVDIDDYRTGKFQPDCFSNRDEMLRQYKEAKERVEGKLDLRLGIEFGEGNHGPEALAKEICSSELDFIIGSLHNVRDYPDFFCIDYESAAQCKILAEKYIKEHFELVKLGCFDVLGHLGYTRRYMKRKGFDIGLEGFDASIAELFKILRDSGKGIEINTSGLRDGTGSAFPDLKFLKLYRELGGEIVTTGSDSHRPEDIGSNLKDGLELLREAGFKYFTVYKDRKPEFLKL